MTGGEIRVAYPVSTTLRPTEFRQLFLNFGDRLFGVNIAGQAPPDSFDRINAPLGSLALYHQAGFSVVCSRNGPRVNLACRFACIDDLIAFDLATGATQEVVSDMPFNRHGGVPGFAGAPFHRGGRPDRGRVGIHQGPAEQRQPGAAGPRVADDRRTHTLRGPDDRNDVIHGVVVEGGWALVQYRLAVGSVSVRLAQRNLHRGRLGTWGLDATREAGWGPDDLDAQKRRSLRATPQGL